MSDKCFCVCLPRDHVTTRFRATPFVFVARLTAVLPAERPELRCNGARAGPGLWPISSQHRTFRQPHLFGSGVSATHASSVRIFSRCVCVRGIDPFRMMEVSRTLLLRGKEVWRRTRGPATVVTRGVVWGPLIWSAADLVDCVVGYRDDIEIAVGPLLDVGRCAETRADLQCFTLCPIELLRAEEIIGDAV